ncbi:hypothetical protein [Pseudomonas sp. RIT-PI-S]|nr:hypothetical protein [Pseudomonas sp. RIT-PI-S]
MLFPRIGSAAGQRPGRVGKKGAHYTREWRERLHNLGAKAKRKIP